MQLSQKTGFARKDIHALVVQTGLDMHGAWLGNEISDKYVTMLAEQAEKLNGTKFTGAKDALVCIEGSSAVYVWAAQVSGDAYLRNVGALNVRGSLATLRSVYGEKNVHVTNEAGARKLLTQKKAHKATLAFYGLSRLAKSEETAKSDAKSTKKSDTKKATVKKIGAKKIDGAKK